VVCDCGGLGFVCCRCLFEVPAVATDCVEFCEEFFFEPGVLFADGAWVFADDVGCADAHGFERFVASCNGEGGAHEDGGLEVFALRFDFAECAEPVLSWHLDIECDEVWFEGEGFFDAIDSVAGGAYDLESGIRLDHFRNNFSHES